MRMNWRLEIARIEFDLLGKESIPGVAAKALEEEIDTPSLRILAGLSPDNIWDIETYWNKTLQEIHVELPTRLDSAWLLIEYYIDRIVKGEIDPYDGIHIIITEVYWKMDWEHNNLEYIGNSVGIGELYALWVDFDDVLMDYLPLDKASKTKEGFLNSIRSEILEAAKRYQQNLVKRKRM
jgi:hypothetical protein